MKHAAYLVVLVVLLSGCASQIPLQIREAPAGSPALEQVRGQVPHYLGAQVRWGGTLVAVENRSAETWLEVVARPLQADGRPVEDGPSSGRFLARYNGFLDPVIFTKGRAITLVGAIEGEQQRPIDEYTYNFPVMGIESHFLWAPLPKPSSYPPPYWGGSWWPYSPYPYPRHYRHRFPYW